MIINSYIAKLGPTRALHPSLPSCIHVVNTLLICICMLVTI